MMSCSETGCLASGIAASYERCRRWLPFSQLRVTIAALSRRGLLVHVMLEGLTIVVMLGLGAVLCREGLFSAVLMLINVILAGMAAFNFWEPAAALIGGISPAVDRFADALLLTTLFLIFLGLLRWATGRLAPRDLGFPRLARQIGGAAAGILVGFFVSGILICIFQTLPWQERFLNYDPHRPMGAGAPDRVWLAMVHRASGVVFDRRDAAWFDADGSFIARYARYRRVAEEATAPKQNRGEFPTVLDASKTPHPVDRGPGP